MEIIKGNKNRLKTIATKLVLGLFLISSLLILLVTQLVNIQMKNYETTVTEMTRNHLMSAAQTLTKLIDIEELALFHTTEDTLKPEFQRIREQLTKFTEDYNVLYAYYWRDYGNGQLQYIIDNDMDPETQDGPWSFYDMDEFDLDALRGNTGVTDLGAYTPTWEGLLSGYAPVYDSEGRLFCVAGVDISDEFIFIQRQGADTMRLIQFIVVPLALVFGILNMLLYSRKTKEIESAHGKLQYFNNNLRRAFSTYLSEDVVEEIISDPTRLQLGGIRRHMTVLFSDVRGFTTIAESLTPEQLVDLLNYYLSTMSDIVLDQKGTIDKYQGDAIIAFFGAPLELRDHALRACVSAILMKRIEGEANRYILEKGISPSPLLTRIGINTGDMVVGNMGTHKKMNYTIISNAVNLASRLEGVNKQYGTWILASESTIRDAGDKLLTRRLDWVKVVGISGAVGIHEILDIKADASDALQEKVHLFTKAMELFRVRNWKDAKGAFDLVLKTFPNDGPSLLYQKRCNQFRDYPPGADWDGVFSLTEK